MNKKTIFNLFLSCLSGILLAISTQEGHLTLVAWFALAPLFYMIITLSEKSTLLEVALNSYLTGFIYFAKLHFWGNVFGIEVWLGITFILSFYFAIWGIFIALIVKKIKLSDSKKIAVIALSWVLFDYFRSLGTIGMNWGSIAYTQYKMLPLIQIVSITGIYGVTFLMALFSSITASKVKWLIENKYQIKTMPKYLKIYIISILMLLVILSLLGYKHIENDKKQTGRTIKISLIQPSIDMDTKNRAMRKGDSEKITQIINEMKDMTYKAAEEKPDIIFWAETSFPIPFGYQNVAENYISSIAKSIKIPIVAGAIEITPDKKFRNSAFLFDACGEIKGKYSKRRLVPFGEYLPLPEEAKKWKVFERVQDLIPGETLSQFKLNDINFATLICFESDFGEYSAQEVRAGAEFISIITNDGWFENHPVAEHHISWNVFRAVENHANLVQTANSGISAYIDYNGNITAKEGLFKKTILTKNITLLKAGTFYSRYGDVFIYLTIVSFIILLFPNMKKSSGKDRVSAGKRKKIK